MIADQELRALVRDAIARLAEATPEPPLPSPFRHHVSHGLLPLLRGADGDGACLIEPSVRCNHCGYCLSYGH